MSAVLQRPEGATSNNPLPVGNNWQQRITTALLRAAPAVLMERLHLDKAAISRLKSGERAVNFFDMLGVADILGYKMVSKDKLCVPDYELHTLRDYQEFVLSNPTMSERFSAWRETQPLRQDWDAE